jgi:hypothetical protein
MSERTSGQALVCRPGSAIKPLGSPAPLRDLVAPAVPRRGLYRLGQMPRLARLRRRTQTPEHRLAPLLPRLRRRALLIRANSSLGPLPSAEISRRRGSPPRRYHRPRSPQLQLRPRRKCSNPPLAGKSTREDIRTQRRFPGCRASAALLRGHDQYL